jgi:hypothetical protein
VGHAILKAIAPITAALYSTIRFLNNPTPTPSGQEVTANDLRANIAEKLSGFDALPLLDELAAAVVADCAVQRGQQAQLTVGAFTLSKTLVESVSGDKQRKLLSALNDKGRVPVADVLLAVYGSKSEKNLEALLKTKDRLNSTLAKKNAGCEVRKEGDTLTLSSL